MSVVTTGDLAKALWPGVNAWTNQSYDMYPEEWREIFDEYRSEKNFEEDVSISGTGLLTEKAEGAGIEYQDFKQTFLQRYTHIVYGSGFIITREMIEDNQYKEVAEKYSRMLGKSCKETKENVAANNLNRGFNSSYTGYDGVELFSTAHKLGKGGTFSNELATPADLSEASLEQAIIDIMGFVDDAGLQIAVNPRKLIVPRQLAFSAERILASNLQNNTANNAVNAIKSMNVMPDGFSVNHYLTDADAWYIKTDCQDGMKLFQRRDRELTNDTDFNSENMKFKITERYVFGWTDPRGMFGSPGA